MFARFSNGFQSIIVRSMSLLPAAPQQGKEPEGADEAGGIWFGNLGGIVGADLRLNGLQLMDCGALCSVPAAGIKGGSRLLRCRTQGIKCEKGKYSKCLHGCRVWVINNSYTIFE